MMTAIKANHLRNLAVTLALVLGLVLVALAAQARPAQAAFPGQNGPIAYATYDSDSGYDQIYTIPSTGGTPTRITSEPNTHYSPDWGSVQQQSSKHKGHHKRH